MQEGAVSLMQMAKISAVLMRLDEARIPYISVLTDPTTAASRQPRHAGRPQHRRAGRSDRVRRAAGHRTDIRQKLPEGFQRSEFLLKHGMLDAVVPRSEMKSYIARALEFFAGPVTLAGAA